MAERQFGPYKLVRQIAVGGMAEIHLAKAAGIAGFEKYVALKMIHPNFAEDEQFIQMLVDEAKIAVQLTHGNIAQTFDLGRVGETYYITMEYVDGADLYKILRRASEQDLEMPLDVCAFIGKEVSSALDHAHRKRDHAGKSLGIVHRDVSPQNVLVSYSGEVKLVDFGIAKATMKVRQTAVGVIKGKYYYMSPEQAWGDPIDHRSDIFSAGIVLYEMITGQMLYLEEDLHKLLEMARKAEIAPPSKLRRGVPPQLERIVMHALAKTPTERYQSAGDLATDLERFLHGYSPVFTASKLSSLLRQVIGEPIQVPDDLAVNIEFRDGPMSTHPLDDSEVAHAIDREELRDENSMLFRVAELDRRAAAEPPPSPAPPPRPSAPPRRPSTPPPIPPAVRPSAPRVTRAADAMPAPRSPTGPIPSIAPPRASGKLPQVVKPRQPHEETRQLDSPAPADPLHDDSGLLTTDGEKLSWESDTTSGGGGAPDDELDNIGERTLITGAPGMPEAAQPRGFMLDMSDDGDHIEATLVTTAPGFEPHDAGEAAEAGHGAGAGEADDDEDGPTLSRDFRVQPARPAAAKPKAPPPAALAAKIHAPAVSELRKPRPSRRTPPGGSPNVLQAIVGSKASEPMPVPRPPPSPSPVAMQATIAMPPSGAMPPGGMSPGMHPGTTQAATTPPGMQGMQGMQGMAGMPAGTTPPPGMQPHGMPPHGMPQHGMPQHGMSPPGMPQHGMPPHGMPQHGMPQHGMPQPGMPQPGMPQHGMPQPGMPSGPYAPTEYGSGFSVGTPGGQPSYNHDASGMPFGIPTPPGVPTAPGAPYPMPGMHPDYVAQPLATQVSVHGYPQLSPGALYPFQPAPQPPSLTGQMRLMEIDEIPSQYKLGAARRRWFTYIVSGLIAVSVAAGVTFLIIRSARESTPTTGSLHIESVPSGAEVRFDGTLLTDRTPLTIDGAPVGTRHKITVSLPHYRARTEDVDIPKTGRTVSVMAQLTSLTGKLLVNTTPAGAEIRINSQVRGVTPTTINGIDIESTPAIELRHKDFPPRTLPLKWDADGMAYVDFRFTR